MFSSSRRSFFTGLAAVLAICLSTGSTTASRRMESIKTKVTSSYLHTQGNKIIDGSGVIVGFSGLNWFGFETATNAPHGLWSRSWTEILDQVKSLGYNTIRLPFSNAVLQPGVMPTGIDYTKNPDLAGLTSLEVMDKIISGAGARGIWVILDNHRSTPGGGPESNGLWYTSDYPESRWIEDWKMLAARYKGNPAVIGTDLRNEPHGEACWGCGDESKDWRLAAERGGNAILSINPDLLIIVEGVGDDNGQSYWWGGNLIGAREKPVRLDIPNRLVYSAHDYPASVHPQPWFSDPNYPGNLPTVWDQYWGYLAKDNLAPVLVGEFGTRFEMDTDRQWFKAMAGYIKQKGLSWTFWSLNPNSGDTGGLLLDNWVKVNTGKQAALAEIQYPFGSAAPQAAEATLTPATPVTPPFQTPTHKPPEGPPFVLEDFESGKLCHLKTFHDVGSSIEITKVSPGKTGTHALKVNYSLVSGGWGGVERKYPLPQDWSGYTHIKFWLYGNNTRNRIRLELLDNRLVGSSEDTSERFETHLVDDYKGWKEFNLPWSAFLRRGDWQPAGAPEDGLGLQEVWGYNFAPLNGSGEFLVDQLQLIK